MIDTAIADVLLPYKPSSSSSFRTSLRKKLSLSSMVDVERFTMGRASPYSTNTSARTSPLISNVLTRADILEALNCSQDSGATLDFSDKNIADIGEAVVKELSKLGSSDELSTQTTVQRIAFGGNDLTVLPKSFPSLVHLRYLTLRSNNFSIFPEVLTAMPSLEILDLSRNRIQALPSEPGSLTNLRVLALSRNKLRRLPSYFSKLRNLQVLKVGHNPFEWPPKAVMEQTDDLDDPDLMLQWIQSLFNWLDENQLETSPIRGGRKPSAESLTHSGSFKDASAEDNYASLSVLTDSEDGVTPTPHTRSFSIDSQSSVYSSASLSADSMKPVRPPPLNLHPLPSPNSSRSSVSPEAYLPTPEDSMNSADDDGSTSPHSITQRQHWRNRSYAYGPQSDTRSSRDSTLTAKKSLPDLRTAKAHFGRRWINETSANENTSTVPVPVPSNVAGSSAAVLPETKPLRIRTNTKSSRTGPLQGPSPPATDTSAPSMDVERNSYFRRLSRLPAPAAPNAIPDSLLTVVDSVRGILFAVSQVYQSLQHYTVYAIDERLSSVLLKVLDPASAYMTQLIEALDRFDSISRRGFPSPSVCRDVLNYCRENVSAFGKAVSVLALQLKVLAKRDDVRYTRQMLLVLYGATAEISNAWYSMAPHLEDIEPFLQELKPPNLNMKAHYSSRSHSQIPPIVEQPEPTAASAPATPTSALPPPLPMPISRAHSSQAEIGRTRMNRRHAGSFSVKDVEIGRSMPSNAKLISPAGGVVSGTASAVPTPRLNTRLPPQPHSLASAITPLPQSSVSPFTPYPLPSSTSRHHIRQDSETLPSASSSSLAVTTPAKAHAADMPCKLNTLVDKEALDAMDGAVKAAPAVWARLDELLNDMPEATTGTRETLTKAQNITNKLQENIKAIQESDDNVDRKAFREDGHVFIKTVVQLSNVVKAYDSKHRLSAQLRKDIAKLTNATQDFVMLMHVSSYSPSSTSKAYSPTVPNIVHSPVVTAASPVVEDPKQNSAGLSRSRSAQPPISSKLAIHSQKTPRSALPNQSFKLP